MSEPAVSQGWRKALGAFRSLGCSRVRCWALQPCLSLLGVRCLEPKLQGPAGRRDSTVSPC